MALFNLTNVHITPLNNAVFTKPVGFRGSETLPAFQFGKMEGYNDRFSKNPFDSNFKSKAEIEQLAKSSPRIMALLKEYNLPLRVNMDVLEGMI